MEQEKVYVTRRACFMDRDVAEKTGHEPYHYEQYIVMGEGSNSWQTYDRDGPEAVAAALRTFWPHAAIIPRRHPLLAERVVVEHDTIVHHDFLDPDDPLYRLAVREGYVRPDEFQACMQQMRGEY